ncbi:FAD/NAD(P)-binding domain-containing protein [Cylindrobasidium torrendii FP15055 ss-10]|uniref:FAD/NAD(P)-binding domain-containing protein n=1 Tax=Cylindrobasidium torrendii FP15055 ss-10 TaxID=1314674 RepID=A0A0D7B2W0_9AGAR|nr:FAD/NAD(P)-binding domain-containing protein [Cylindrobasidium torrendii FP15055 ss-10]
MSDRILIIGAGVAGLVTLRNLTERGEYTNVQLVERRDDVGGVWYLDNPEEKEAKPRWPSPAYPGLIGNVLPEYLSISGFPFPEPPMTPYQPFPTLVETHEYLKNFAKPYLENGKIRLNIDVQEVRELPEGQGWKVVIKDWNQDGKVKAEIYAKVVIAVSWYDNPVWPNTEGLDAVREEDLAVHAKWWRGPTGYEGKRALVIGNANSSNDMAAHLAPVAESVYRSIRRPAFPGFPSLPDERIKDVAPVVKYEVDEDNKITATLKDGTIIPDLDVILVGTGYQAYPSFVRVLANDFSTRSIMDPAPDPHRVPGLHRYILYAPNPSLAFTLPMMCFTPFTMADLQSTWLALAWRGEVPVPDTVEGRLKFEAERLKAIEEWVSSIDNPSALYVYGVLGTYEQQYAIDLKADIVKVRPQLENVLPEWSDERTKKRETMYPVKLQSLYWMKKKGLRR